uniref:Uncharacterized protein n=1 Tax=Tetranychus urticae TaxID=32264 RepID=T1JTA5_TETUR
MPLVHKVVGILKVKSESGEQARKGSVQFKCEPIVIGYCDDDDSGNEEEEEFDYSDYNPDDDDDHSEEDSEFSRLTASNTRFNSIGANLRDAKILQTFGQINNQSVGIAFRIGDFKSETRKHDYDETLIGCNRVSELIGEEKRGKLTNGSNGNSTIANGTNNLLSTKNGSGDNYINNKKNVDGDELVKKSNGVNGNNNLTDHDGSNGRPDDNVKRNAGNMNNNNSKDNNSTLPIVPITLNSNTVNSTIISSPMISTVSSSHVNNTNTTTTSSLTYSSGKPLETSNTSTNKVNNTPASANTNNATIPDNTSDTVNNDTSNIMGNGGSLSFKATDSSAKYNTTNNSLKSEISKTSQLTTPLVLISSTHCTTVVTITTTTCSSSNKLNSVSTCAPHQTTPSSLSSVSSASPIVTIAPMKSEAVNAKEKLTCKSYQESSDDTNGNKSSYNNGENQSTTVADSHNELTCISLPVTNGKLTQLEINDDYSIDPRKVVGPEIEYTSSKTVDETEVIFIGGGINRLSLVSKDDQVENELYFENRGVNRKKLESIDSEMKSNDDPDVDDCSSTTDVADSAVSNVFTSTDEDDDDDNEQRNDQNDNNEVNNEVNDDVVISSVSLTLVNKFNDTREEERCSESIEISANINNNNNLTTNGKINSINDERSEIPKKPERTLKSLKPKIPSKPFSLSHGNKVNDEDYFYGNGIETHLNSNDNSDNTKQFSCDNGLNNSVVDQFAQSKSEINSTSWDNNHQSSRELRLAELAQELESVRHPGKRQAPIPPPSTHEVSDRQAKFNTLTRSGLPAPPPRPPPPSGLKHIVNGVTNGYHGSNIFHSNGNSNNNSGSTKFSLKKLLKLSKDDNDLEHNGESISGKIWKHKFDLDRRKSSPGHNVDSQDRSTSGSYDVNRSSFYGNGRERSYSLSGNSCLPQPQQLLLNQQAQQQQNKPNGFRPVVPARRSRSNDVNLNNNDKNSIDSQMLNRLITSSTNGSFHCKPIGISTQSQLTISPVSSPTNSAYTVIAKYNADTLNRILHNYSLTHQSYKNISKKDLFYESFRLIGPESKIYKDAYLKSETISANFLVTPLAYSIRSEVSFDLKYGQFIDPDENVKMFALKPEFDLIITLDRLLDEDSSELTGSLNLKNAAFIILQFISLLKYYQANGIEGVNEDQLKLTMLCCNKKQTTNNMYLISPSFDYVSNVTKHYSDSSTSLSLCKCVKVLVRNLRRKLTKSDDLLTLVEDILHEETSSSLTIAKSLCEIILFEVPFNFESQGTLELWLDIQRTKFINLLNYETEKESASHKTVHNYYFMLFLTRSNLKILFQCINQVRGKLLSLS